MDFSEGTGQWTAVWAAFRGRRQGKELMGREGRQLVANHTIGKSLCSFDHHPPPPLAEINHKGTVKC